LTSVFVTFVVFFTCVEVLASARDEQINSSAT